MSENDGEHHIFAIIWLSKIKIKIFSHQTNPETIELDYYILDSDKLFKNGFCGEISAIS